MARGYIYEVNTNLDRAVKINEAMFYESIDSLAVDYVSDLDVEEQNCLKQDLLDMLKKIGAKIIQEGDLYGYILSEDVKMNLFRNRYRKAQAIFKQMTLKEFSTSSLYSLRELIHDDYDDCIYMFDSLYPFDQWLRESECDVPYYLGNIVFMH